MVASVPSGIGLRRTIQIRFAKSFFCRIRFLGLRAACTANESVRPADSRVRGRAACGLRVLLFLLPFVVTRNPSSNSTFGRTAFEAQPHDCPRGSVNANPALAFALRADEFRPATSLHRNIGPASHDRAKRSMDRQQQRFRRAAQRHRMNSSACPGLPCAGRGH